MTTAVSNGGKVYLTKNDASIKITNGINSGAATIYAPLGYSIEGQPSAKLQQGKYVVLELNNSKRFVLIEGNFLAAPSALNNNTIPASNVTGLPGAQTGAPFKTIVNQANYNFDGTVTAWNPNGINLIGIPQPFFYADGSLKTPAVDYTFNASTGTLTLIGKVFDLVPCILAYQLLNATS